MVRESVFFIRPLFFIQIRSSEDDKQSLVLMNFLDVAVDGEESGGKKYNSET